MPRKKSTSIKKISNKEPLKRTKVKATKKKSTQKAKKKTIKPSLFAIIKIGGKQYKVKEKDIIKVDRIEVKEGKEIEFSDILLIAEEDDVKIGTPYVPKTCVKAHVLEQGKDKKIIVLKYKPKKRYRKTYGHRQQYTKLEIKEILIK